MIQIRIFAKSLLEISKQGQSVSCVYFFREFEYALQLDHESREVQTVQTCAQSAIAYVLIQIVVQAVLRCVRLFLRSEYTRRTCQLRFFAVICSVWGRVNNYIALAVRRLYLVAAWYYLLANVLVLHGRRFVRQEATVLVKAVVVVVHIARPQLAASIMMLFYAAVRANITVTADGLFVSLRGKHLALLFRAWSTSSYLAFYFRTVSATWFWLDDDTFCAKNCLQVIFNLLASIWLSCLRALHQVQLFGPNIDETTQTSTKFIVWISGTPNISRTLYSRQTCFICLDTRIDVVATFKSVGAGCIRLRNSSGTLGCIRRCKTAVYAVWVERDPSDLRQTLLLRIGAAVLIYSYWETLLALRTPSCLIGFSGIDSHRLANVRDHHRHCRLFHSHSLIYTINFI